MKYFLIFLCAALIAVLLYKILRAVFNRIGFYNALEEYCEKTGGTIKKNSLFKSVFKVYPGYDIEMTDGDGKCGVKFFPGYFRNRIVLIKNEKNACLLKRVGTTGVTSRGSLPGVGSFLNISDEVEGRRIRIDLTGIRPGYKNVLLFSPACKRIYYVRKNERAEAYNGDDVFGYKVFYKKDCLAAFLEKQ